MMGGKMGTKKPVHPNDHVNKSSTNDVFPTAMHIAIAMKTKNMLLPSLRLLEKEIGKKVKEFKSIVKLVERIFRCNTVNPGTRIFRLPFTIKNMY